MSMEREESFFIDIQKSCRFGKFPGLQLFFGQPGTKAPDCGNFVCEKLFQSFHIWNELGMYGNEGKAKQAYFKDLPEQARADQCHECGKCEEVCPQGLSIRENLKEVSKEMETLK